MLLDGAELAQASWVHCEMLTTLPTAMLEERLGALAPETMRRVDDALKASLGLA